MHRPTRHIATPALFVGLLALLAGTPSPRAAQATEAGPRTHVLQAALAALDRHRANVRDARRLTVIDYDLPFTAPRLWVLDTKDDNAVLAHSRVSHAWKSGALYATRFSNTPGSNLSSPGSYVTARYPYQGSFGHSLRVRGLDRGVNHNAYGRAIIFHPDMGLSHSLGCFMLPDAVARSLIDMIAGGTFVYVHAAER